MVMMLIVVVVFQEEMTLMNLWAGKAGWEARREGRLGYRIPEWERTRDS